MAAQKLSGSGKRRTAPKASLSWTEDMRITLDILQKDENLTWNLRSEVFHAIWNNHIRSCGLESVQHTTLRSQCSNAERKKSKAWMKIAAGPQTSSEVAAWQQLRQRVEVALKNLDTAPKALPVLRKGIRSQPTRYPVPTPPATDTPARSAAVDAVRGTPLSKRPAIATWSPDEEWSIVENEDAGQETEPEPEPAAKRRRTTRAHVEIQVQVQRHIQRAAPLASARSEGGLPRTPKKVPRRDLPKSPYYRPGDELRGFQAPQLTAEEHARTEEELVPVPDEAMHPPLASLFFRYYVPQPDELGRSQNDESGFVAGRFAHSVRMYMDPPRHPEWIDIFNHIDSVKAPSPFISVSNALFWILRLALKEASKNVEDARIAIIDAKRIDTRAIFHAAPLHAETKKKFPYHEGAWHYHGTHEFLIWREILGEAIIKTIRVRDILRLARSVPAMNEALAFPTLVSNTGYKKSILPTLRSRKMFLSPAVIEGMAAMIEFLGLNHTHMDGISHIVSDIIQGWALHLDPASDWASLAAIFEQALLTRAGNTQQLRVRDSEARLSFLDGLRWGCSKHFNTRHNARHIQLMQKQSQKVGLNDPVKILTDELDAAKVRLRLLTNESSRLVQNSETPTKKRQRLLSEAVASSNQQDDDEGEDTIVVARPRCRGMVEDEDGEDSDDVFEMGEDGFVV